MDKRNIAFKTAFIKKSVASGFSKAEALDIFEFQTKKADINDNYMGVKQLMTEKGYAPQYNIDDTDPYARVYNDQLLHLRDEAHEADPNMEALKAGVSQGAKGGLAGFAGGHLAGAAGERMLNPNLLKYRFLKNLPGKGRALGMAIGALAEGAPAALAAKKETEAAKSLANPQMLQHMMDQLSRERQLSNNQIGTYRPIPIEPQGY